MGVVEVEMLGRVVVVVVLLETLVLVISEPTLSVAFRGAADNGEGERVYAGVLALALAMELALEIAVLLVALVVALLLAPAPYPSLLSLLGAAAPGGKT